MFKFNFNFTKTKSKTIKTNNKVLEHNIEGIVNVELNGTFYITTINNKRFNISKESYNCKNKTNIYPLILDKHTKSRICYIRNENKQELIHTAYFPFAPGLCVKGDIIEEYGSIYFNINKVYLDNKVKGSIEAFNFYRDNFKEIVKNIKNK